LLDSLLQEKNSEFIINTLIYMIVDPKIYLTLKYTYPQKLREGMTLS